MHCWWVSGILFGHLDYWHSVIWDSVTFWLTQLGKVAGWENFLLYLTWDHLVSGNQRRQKFAGWDFIQIWNEIKYLGFNTNFKIMSTHSSWGAMFECGFSQRFLVGRGWLSSFGGKFLIKIRLFRREFELIISEIKPNFRGPFSIWEMAGNFAPL